VSSDPQIEIWEAASGKEGLSIFKAHRPDLVILDLNLPGLGGLEVIGRLKVEDAAVRILVLSVHDNALHVTRAMQAGATELSDVAWDVVDRTKLQAEASQNALGKARTVADSMALGLGTKLGALVYASNSAPIRPSNWPFFSGLSTSSASVSGVIGTPLPPKIIKLLPEKINEKTTVYAVFAIE